MREEWKAANHVMREEWEAANVMRLRSWEVDRERVRTRWEAENAPALLNWKQQCRDAEERWAADTRMWELTRTTRLRVRDDVVTTLRAQEGRWTLTLESMKKLFACFVDVAAKSKSKYENVNKDNGPAKG